MRILFLTQYFPPEVGAPQNRLYELATRLSQKGAEITVLTAMPNYPQMLIHKEYRNKLHVRENINELQIHRVYIYVKNSKSVLFRLLNYFSFVISSFFFGWFKLGKFDYIFCESPPLFLGISAYLLKKIKKCRLIFNVSDLWPESAEKLGIIKNKILLNISTKLEEFLYKKSELITGQTKGIVKNISSRFPHKKVYWLPNGVNFSFFRNDWKSDWKSENGFSKSDFLLLYAGILGHAQGLEVIIHTAAILKNKQNLKFIIIGSGPEKEKLMHLKKELSLDNIFFFDTFSKQKMPDIIASTDVSIIPLKKIELFKGAIPSKIFENLAMKKPILLGIEGEAKELFIDEGKCGLFFEPENPLQLAQAIENIYANKQLMAELGSNGYNYAEKNFNIESIVENFWMEIKKLAV